MRVFLNLLKREMRLVTGDHSLLLTLLIAPVLYAFFYGSIYQNKEEKEVKIAVVDADNSQLSRLLIEKIDATPVADVISSPHLNDAQEKLHTTKVQGYLYIPEGLQEKVLSLKQANINLALNTSRFLPSSDLTGAITKVALTVSAGVRLQYFKKTGQSSQVSLRETNPVRLNYKPLYNESESYGGFLLPGLLALILQQTLLIGLAGSMAIEREKNKIMDLYQYGKQNLSAVLWGKGLWYFILFMSYAFFFLTVNFNILQLPQHGDFWEISILMALFLLTLIPLGLWLGSWFKSQVLSVQIMAFSTYPIFLITGYSLPYESLPQVVQWISALLPTTPFLQAYRSIVQTGGTLTQNKFEVIHLIILWVLFCGLFLWRMHRLSKKSPQSVSNQMT